MISCQILHPHCRRIHGKFVSASGHVRCSRRVQARYAHPSSCISQDACPSMDRREHLEASTTHLLFQLALLSPKIRGLFGKSNTIFRVSSQMYIRFQLLIHVICYNIFGSIRCKWSTRLSQFGVCATRAVIARSGEGRKGRVVGLYSLSGCPGNQVLKYVWEERTSLPR